MKTAKIHAETAIEPCRFMADAMLGKLSRWLRILGYDAAYERKIDDRRLIDRAIAENRLILTRDARMIQRKIFSSIPFLFVRDDHLSDQLRQIVRELNLSVSAGLLTRCVECNRPVSPVASETVADRVPPYVLETQTRFSLCPGCRRIYWHGTHPERIQDRLKTVF